ncbi:MAG: FHA domain-containing protein [Proteobacteria bacterium]|nr:FHA domain-containing protein [Pseudomonadota bacterium]
MREPHNKQLIATLTIETPDGVKKKIKLRTEEATIFGRSQGDVVLNDPEVSSSHCQIHYIDNHHHIFDMNSTNGTFLNDGRIIKSRLENNDIITVGQSSIRFELVTGECASLENLELANKKIHSDKITRATDNLLKEQQESIAELPDLKIDTTYQDGTTDTLTFNQEVVYIGRASSFGKFNQDDQISRKHLKIKINNDYDVIVEDQDSTNGLFINNKQVTGIHKVYSTDVLVIGNTQLKITLLG